MDYSKTSFSQGLVCMNTNNNQLCVVISDGQTQNPKTSLVIECDNEYGFTIHVLPNEALVPTGKIAVSFLKSLSIVMKDTIVYDI